MTSHFDWNGAPDTRDTRPEPSIDELHWRTRQDDAMGAAHHAATYGCRCGQTTITPTGRCDACEKARNAPPAAPERLFEPAPAPMPGQIMGRWDPYQ